MNRSHPLLFACMLALGLSPESRGQWVNTGGLSTTVTCLSGRASSLFAGTIGDGIFLSTDNGGTWGPVNSGLADLIVWALAAMPNGQDGMVTFAGTHGGIFVTTNNGSSWTSVLSGVTVRDLLVDGTTVFAATEGGGVYVSTDTGSTWTQINSGLASLGSWALATTPNGGGRNLFVGLSGEGVFRSTDDGLNWTAANSGLTNPYLSALGSSRSSRTEILERDSVNGANLFAGTSSPPGNPNGVFVSTNDGESWTSVLTCSDVNAIAAFDTNVFVGTDGGGVYLLTNNGARWRRVNTGLSALHVMDLIVGRDASGTLYAATGNGGGVWRRPLSEMITAVGQSIPDIPAEFSLEQNYPNPFNASTCITFSLPRASFVKLAVFNTLGQEVRRLVHGSVDAGAHRVEFDGGGMPTGMYLYVLSTAGFRSGHRMLLLK